VLERKSVAVEVVLWTPWVYHGQLKSTDMECDLIGISAKAFQAVLTQHPGTIWLCQKYGNDFINQLNKLEEDGEHLNDLLAVESAIEICKHA